MSSIPAPYSAGASCVAAYGGPREPSLPWSSSAVATEGGKANATRMNRTLMNSPPPPPRDRFPFDPLFSFFPPSSPPFFPFFQFLSALQERYITGWGGPATYGLLENGFFPTCHMRDSIQATKLLLGSSFLNWRRGEKYHKAIYEDWKFIAARFFSCAFCGPSRRSLLLLPPRPPPPLNKLVRRHAAWGGAQKPLRWLTPIADSPLFLREPPLSFIIYPKPIERCCSHKKKREGSLSPSPQYNGDVGWKRGTL